MITNDYIKGYIAALDHINDFLVNSLKETDDYVGIDERSGYFTAKNYIKEVKENYKQLVKELNEAQSKKTRS